MTENGNDSKIELLRQNLKDAGCSDEMAEEYLSCEEQGLTGKQVNMLTMHRCNLVENMHQEQRKIDCLDYLIYQKFGRCCCKELPVEKKRKKGADEHV